MTQINGIIVGDFNKRDKFIDWWNENIRKYYLITVGDVLDIFNTMEVSDIEPRYIDFKYGWIEPIDKSCFERIVREDDIVFATKLPEYLLID